MDHVLTVGEIYDRAIDLCLRNAAKIALILGGYFLFIATLAVLHTNYEVLFRFLSMHGHSREAIWPGTWITILTWALRFTLLPILISALFVLFDRTLRDQRVVLKDLFRSSIPRLANVIVASFICSLIGYLALIAIIITYVAILKWAIFVVIFVAVLAAIIIWIVSFLVLGSAIGMARVALDAGRVLPSMRIGIAAAFSKLGRRRIAGVAASLLLILIVGTVGFVVAGVAAFALTGSDMANVAIRSIGDVISWSIWTAVATVYYRSLVPVGQGQV